MTNGDTTGASSAATAHPAELQVQDWKIWYLFAGYISTDVPDLRQAAIRLLRAKFGNNVVLDDGSVAFKTQDHVEWGRIFEVDSIEASQTGVTFSENIPLNLRVSIFKAVLARSAARNVFLFLAPRADQSLSLTLPNITAHFGLDEVVELEVTLKLFQSGIILLSFLSSLDSEGMSLAKFIDNHVNLSLRRIVALDVDRDMALLQIEAFLRQKGLPPGKELSIRPFSFPLPRRVRMLLLRHRLREFLLQRSRELLEGAESRSEKSVDPERIRTLGGDASQLSGVALEYMQGLAHALGKPRKGLAYLLLGEPAEPVWRGYWSGSPYIHLRRFAEQSPSVVENEQKYGESFRWILARTPPSRGTPLRSSLPENARIFSNYAVYIGEAATLSVAPVSSDDGEIGDGTEGNPISARDYHHQVVGEYIEYGRMLYMSLQHELEETNLDWDKLFRIRQRQVQFEIDLSQTGRYGEIRSLLRAGLKARGIPELKEQTQSLLALSEAMASVRENRRLTMTGMVLAIVLSLLGLPGAIDFLNAHIAPHIPWMAAQGEKSLLRIGILALVSSAAIVVVPLGSWLVFKRLRWISSRDRIKRQ